MTGRMKYYDIHCHFVPGVDDGAQSTEAALELIEADYKDGVRVIFMTPHQRPRLFEVPLEKVVSRYEMIKTEALKRFPDLEIYLGCECFMHMEVLERIERNPELRLGGGRFVLAEFSTTHSAGFILERTDELISAGYEVIIAHAERYYPIREDIEFLKKLKRMGAYIQINADSIIGTYGHKMKKFCKKLLNEDLVDFVGSDAHNIKSRPPRIGKCADYVAKKYGMELRDKIFTNNPAGIVKKL